MRETEISRAGDLEKVPLTEVGTRFKTTLLLLTLREMVLSAKAGVVLLANKTLAVMRLDTIKMVFVILPFTR